jgi:hypothetical protein
VKKFVAVWWVQVFTGMDKGLPEIPGGYLCHSLGALHQSHTMSQFMEIHKGHVQGSSMKKGKMNAV